LAKSTYGTWLLVGSLSVQATTFNVNSEVDAVDANPGDGVCATADSDCTLRAAIEETNVLAGADTINLPAGTYLLTLPGANPDPFVVENFLYITGDLNLIGAGKGTTIIDGGYTGDGTEFPANGLYNVLAVGGAFTPITVKVSDVTITQGSVYGVDVNGADYGVELTLERCTISKNGLFPYPFPDLSFAPPRGHGIAVSLAALTLIDSTVSSNRGANGAGIYIDRSIVTLRNTTVNGNTATALIPNGIPDPNGVGGITGADIFNESPSTIMLINSTVSGNHVDTNGSGGGGIANLGGEMMLINSTVSNNTVNGVGFQFGGQLAVGGGIVNSWAGSLTVVNSTVSRNLVNSHTGELGGGASYGGGIFNFRSATLHLHNATITANTVTSFSPSPEIPPGIGIGGGVVNGIEGSDVFLPGTVTVQNSIIAGNSALTSNNDYSGPLDFHSFSLIGGNPLLGPLANNGGLTQTHALKVGSPALDAGDPAGCRDEQGNVLATDQRGASRPFGPRCDIGAFERGSLMVISPNGNEVWPLGSAQTIKWDPGAVSGKVRIELSRDNGGSWETLLMSTANDGTQNWKVKGPITTQALIRVCSALTPIVCDGDVSDHVFTLGGGSITVTSPNGDEHWAIGSKQTIQWTSRGITGKVRIELSRSNNGPWEVLFNSTADDGVQNWKVKGPTTNQARIRVSSELDMGAVDTSDEGFSIQ
jgi:hypothetical protein